ncbi:unnamed protein product [Rotaria sordida]|uniref:Uncharacterized protein n=1 Tax=Rotaria sordida TaxID=392033 RepID=A0A813TS59_9BILA|nr:unnamed protein product [Rotaria sordida]CAF0820111.1 unnamed protein product [Rotaria sordida]CAF3967247.1 unnamed protein product [Rotaria sordida]CAF4098529.1 unnamed protein product [Rotaria sordida]
MIVSFINNSVDLFSTVIKKKGGDSDLLDSLFGLANRLTAKILRSGSDIDGISTFIDSDLYHSYAKVFDISSINVIQILHGLDG